MNDRQKMLKLLEHTANNTERSQLKAERRGNFSLHMFASQLAHLWSGPAGSTKRQATWKFDGQSVSVDLFGRWETKYGNTVSVSKEEFAELIQLTFRRFALPIQPFGARDWFGFSNVLKQRQRRKLPEHPAPLPPANIGGSYGLFAHSGFIR